MSKRFFGDIGPVRFEGLKSDNPYAYRHYDPSRVVMGKTMAEHLRPAVCYWHNFAWMGTDMFGAPHKLGGANDVLWGGREGYETLLNTDLRREQDQLGRFLSLVVDYKHKI